MLGHRGFEKALVASVVIHIVAFLTIPMGGRVGEARQQVVTQVRRATVKFVRLARPEPQPPQVKRAQPRQKTVRPQTTRRRQVVRRAPASRKPVPSRPREPEVIAAAKTVPAVEILPPKETPPPPPSAPVAPEPEPVVMRLEPPREKPVIPPSPPEPQVVLETPGAPTPAPSAAPAPAKSQPAMSPGPSAPTTRPIERAQGPQQSQPVAVGRPAGQPGERARPPSPGAGQIGLALAGGSKPADETPGWAVPAVAPLAAKSAPVGPRLSALQFGTGDREGAAPARARGASPGDRPTALAPLQYDGSWGSGSARSWPRTLRTGGGVATGVSEMPGGDGSERRVGQGLSKSQPGDVARVAEIPRVAGRGSGGDAGGPGGRGGGAGAGGPVALQVGRGGAAGPGAPALRPMGGRGASATWGGPGETGGPGEYGGGRAGPKAALPMAARAPGGAGTGAPGGGTASDPGAAPGTRGSPGGGGGGPVAIARGTGHTTGLMVIGLPAAAAGAGGGSVGEGPGEGGTGRPIAGKLGPQLVAWVGGLIASPGQGNGRGGSPAGADTPGLGRGGPVVLMMGGGERPGVTGGPQLPELVPGGPGSGAGEGPGGGGAGPPASKAGPAMMVFLPDGLLPGLPAVGSGPGGGAKAGAESGAPVALPGGRTGGGGVFGLPPLPGSITAALGPYVAGLGPGGAAGSGVLPDTKTEPGPGGIHVGVAGSFDMPLGVTTGDYQADAEGMPNLLAEVRKRTKVHVTIQERYVPLTLADLKNLPVVHVRGHRPFSFTPQEREVLRQYVAQGGTILGEDSHGPFGECFRREIRKIFGEAPRDLPLDHEIYRSHYVLGGIPAGDMGERYPIQGVPVGSRLGVIFSRNDYGDCWEGTGGWVKPESREPAFQIGTNIFVYIVAHWQKRQQR